MTGETARSLGLGWMLVASLGCTGAAGSTAAAAPGNAGSPARNEADAGAAAAAATAAAAGTAGAAGTALASAGEAGAAVPACDASWPESPKLGRPHWIAIHDPQGDLSVIDIADPNSELLTLSSHEATGEDVHDSYIQWSTDGRWLAYATIYAQGGMALYVVEMTSDEPGLPRLIAGSPQALLVIDEVHWSPRTNQLVYVVSDLPPDQAPSGTLMVAAIEEGEAERPSHPERVVLPHHASLGARRLEAIPANHGGRATACPTR